MTSANPQEPFSRISAAEAKEMIERGDVQVVDVRRPDEYTASHLSDTTLIPVDDLYGRMDELSEDKDLIFHCAVGVRSALACEIAAAMGRTRCFNMEGGIDAWKANAFPVESGPYQG